MSDEEIPLSKKDQFAIAIARGKSIAAWARENQVPASTAYGWAGDPDLRRLVDEWRRHSLDRALGWMAGDSMRAVKGITNLGETPNPSRFSSGRIGPFCSTRWRSPSRRISSTAWPRSSRSSVLGLENDTNEAKFYESVIIIQNQDPVGVAANSGVDSGLDKREEQPGRAEGKKEGLNQEMRKAGDAPVGELIIRDILASSPTAAEILRPHLPRSP